MKYLLIFCCFIVLACDPIKGINVERSAVGSATLDYDVSSTNLIADRKEFSTIEFINFLASKANISWDEINRITIKSINGQLIINENNSATSVNIKSSVASKDCSGNLSPLTPFSLDNFVPLFFGGFDIPLNAEGVTALNNVLSDGLPIGDYNSFGSSNCEGIVFTLDGNVSPEGSLASLKLMVTISFNIEYSVCTENVLLQAISPASDEC